MQVPFCYSDPLNHQLFRCRICCEVHIRASLLNCPVCGSQASSDDGMSLIGVHVSHNIRKFIPHTLWDFGVLVESPSCFRTWSDVDEVPWLEPVDILCIDFRILQKFLIPFFRRQKRDRDLAHHSHRNYSMKTGFKSEYTLPSLS